MNGADLLVVELQRYGISHIYTLCGNGLDPIFTACHRAGLRVIDTRNEQAAAYMADAVGRLTRKVGVCAVSTGVAHINALTGVCNAWFDGSPMLLITGASDSATRDRGNFQDMDTVGLAEPLVKLARWVDRPGRIALDLHEALGAATAGRPGPVHLTIPTDVLSGDVSEEDHDAARRLPSTVAVVGERAAADEAAVALACDHIRKAERPMIVAGSGVFYADGGDELARLAGAMKAPMAVPIWDRGAIEQPLPQFVGVIGAASGGPSILPEADLVLLAGACVDYRVGYLEPPGVAENAVTIRCDVDANELNQGRAATVSLLGDPKSVLGQLARALETEGHEGTPDWLAEAKRRDQEFRRKWTEAAGLEALPCTGHHIVDAIRQVVTDETFLLVDGGNIGQWFHMAMCDRYPGRWMTCGRSAVVGWGIPSAAAVRSVYPDAPILLLSGDGSATFTLAELETASRQNLPYVCVVADDSAWGIVVSGCRRRGATPVACELGPIDFAKVAEGFGAIGVRMEDPTKLPAAIEEGFAADRPTLIHVPMCTGGPAD
jgi:acetolactate synthase-1/2/3 large subunit